MASIARGEIYWADLEPVRGHEQGGQRPVLIISHDLFNDRSETVIAMAITSQPQHVGFPFSFRLPDGILPRECWVKPSQIHTLSTGRLGNRAGKLADANVDHVVSGLLQLVS